VSPRSDVYAVGAMAYALLTGRSVFSGKIVEIVGHHMHSKPVPPSERLGRPVPPMLERPVPPCPAKKPDDRPAAAGGGGARRRGGARRARGEVDGCRMDPAGRLPLVGKPGPGHARRTPRGGATCVSGVPSRGGRVEQGAQPEPPRAAVRRGGGNCGPAGGAHRTGGFRGGMSRCWSQRCRSPSRRPPRRPTRSGPPRSSARV